MTIPEATRDRIATSREILENTRHCIAASKLAIDQSLDAIQWPVYPRDFVPKRQQ